MPKLTKQQIISHLDQAADILRGPVDPSQYRVISLTVFFLKRLNDQFEYKKETLGPKKSKLKDFYGDYWIPDSGKYSILLDQTKNFGKSINDVCKAIEKEHSKLDGVLSDSSFTNKKTYPDSKLQNLIMHFNSINLSDLNLESTDYLGEAYEHFLTRFAEESGKTAGQFFTPREIVKLMVQILDPDQNMSICDPTCGSGGMLLWSYDYVKNVKKQNPKGLILDGQDISAPTIQLAKLNMLLHEIDNVDIEFGDILENPRHIDSHGNLKKYDRVIANYPFSMNWDQEKGRSDKYNRFKFGCPSAKKRADFAFIQHMYSILNDKGKAAIVSSQGPLFRGSEELKIRKEFVDRDIIECIISLPVNLFYGTGVPACIFVLNKNKTSTQKNKIKFIYGDNDYDDLKKQHKLRIEDVKKILSAYSRNENIDRYCSIVNYEELTSDDNNYILNIKRYVETMPPEEIIDVQKVTDELNKLKDNRKNHEEQLNKDLKKLGFRV